MITKLERVEHRHLQQTLRTMQQCNCDIDQDIFCLNYNLFPASEYLEKKYMHSIIHS